MKCSLSEKFVFTVQTFGQIVKKTGNIFTVQTFGQTVKKTGNIFTVQTFGQTVKKTDHIFEQIYSKISEKIQLFVDLIYSKQ